MPLNSFFKKTTYTPFPSQRWHQRRLHANLNPLVTSHILFTFPQFAVLGALKMPICKLTLLH